MQSRRTTWALLLLGASGCVGADGAERTGGGYLLLEQDAREAGYRIEGMEGSALPAAVEPGEDVVLIGPDGSRTPLRIAEDEVVRVGARGALERAVLGRSAARDRVEVEATSEAAHALAEELGAAIAEEHDGVFVLEGPDVVASSSGVGAPAGLDEVRWIAVTEERAPTRGGGAVAPVATASLPALAQARALDPAALIPPSARKIEQHTWPIDAMLPATVTCDDPVAGVWVSREHYDTYQDWYLYRVELRRSRRDPSRLTGTMTSRSWDGDSSRALPSSCDLFDWTVSMPIEGRVEQDGRIRFGGTSFRVTEAACGTPSDYRTDQFSGELMAGGDGIKAVNNDGARAVNDPHTFRRIACR